MCRDCGCGLPGETPIGVSAHQHGHKHEDAHDHPHEHENGHADDDHHHEHEHSHEHEHVHEHEHGPGYHHGHDHAHPHTHPHPHTHAHDHGEAHHEHEHGAEARRVIELRQAILGKNDRQAERNRGFFHASGLLVLNVLSSPGSGKTTLLGETVRGLGKQLRTGIIVGDLATERDAERLRESGAPVVQITTGTVCHLDAEMVARAAKQLNLGGLELLIIENVGNLVCPAAYDLGEDLRVVLWSVTEGEDKPLKYPPMFQAAHAVVISKMDLAKACDYDAAAASRNLRRIAPEAQVFQLSAKTGEGMQSWREFLLGKVKQTRTREAL